MFAMDVDSLRDVGQKNGLHRTPLYKHKKRSSALSVDFLEIQKWRSPSAGEATLTVAVAVEMGVQVLCSWLGYYARRMMSAKKCLFGSRSLQQIYRDDYKGELVTMLSTCWINRVMVCAPFAVNSQVSFGIKGGGGWGTCCEFQNALVDGKELKSVP